MASASFASTVIAPLSALSSIGLTLPAAVTAPAMAPAMAPVPAPRAPAVRAERSRASTLARANHAFAEDQRRDAVAEARRRRRESEAGGALHERLGAALGHRGDSERRVDAQRARNDRGVDAEEP